MLAIYLTLIDNEDDKKSLRIYIIKIGLRLMRLRLIF